MNETSMTEEEARLILGDAIKEGNALDTMNSETGTLGGYAYWSPWSLEVVLDGPFGARELEALAWWIRNKGK